MHNYNLKFNAFRFIFFNNLTLNPSPKEWEKKKVIPIIIGIKTFLFKMYLISIFVFFNVISEAQTSDSTYLTLYKNSDMIFTGVLISKYQLPSYTNDNDCDKQPRFLLEFQLTEIQKGKRRMKMQIETPDSSFKMNKEYLMFCNKIKSHGNKIYTKTHSEEVCLNCNNPGIKAVYKIVNRRPFSTLKQPLDPNNMIPKGCGCH